METVYNDPGRLSRTEIVDHTKSRKENLELEI